MKTFRDITNEMAVRTGPSPKNVFSKEKEFNLKDLIVVTDKLPHNRTVFKDKENYYLVQNEKYKGHIGYIKKDGRAIEITESHSELKNGFYNIMFSSILTDVHEILSDLSLSDSAIKAYENLNRTVSNFELAIKIGPAYKKFSGDSLLSSRRAKVSIKSKHNISEIFEEYYHRIEHQRSYKKSYNEDNKLTEWFLYHDGWDRF